MENHADTRVFFSLYLESLGHTVISADSMTDAFATSSLAPHDMFISDLLLPDGDGWELLGLLQLPRSIYALAISGLGTSADRARSEAAGYRRHLLKPVLLGELDSVLQEAAQECVAG